MTSSKASPQITLGSRNFVAVLVLIFTPLKVFGFAIKLPGSASRYHRFNGRITNLEFCPIHPGVLLQMKDGSVVNEE
jgi:hypothetical protein